MSAQQQYDQDYDYDFIVIGSGFGGSVAAHRLTEKGYTVAVLEQGLRWTEQNLPDSNWNLRKWLWRPGLGLHGFFNMRVFRHVVVLHGCAVGGGSVTYANTLLQPKDKVWDEGSWAGLHDWKTTMPSHYDEARRMLGVTQNRILGDADHVLKKLADASGVGHTYYLNPVATFFPPEGEAGGKTYPDPYFGGEGPERTSCTGCGGCMMGCKVGAKNVLTKNYLYFAEKHGAKVFAETRVVDVAPLNRRADGAEGYEVRTVKSTAWFDKQPRLLRCRGVVFAASSMGTQELLFDLKDRGLLPNVSEQLGNRVRTNAESLIGLSMPASAGMDMSRGTAIGSGIYLDEHTHIEATRYPAGSDAMGMGITVLTGGKPGLGRILLMFWLIAKLLLSKPLKTLRAVWPIGFARKSLIFLVMQTLDGFLNMRWRRPWYAPWRKTLVTEGEPIPTYIPQANAFAELGAKMYDAIAGSMTTEVLFNVPTTAHCMGGASMGRTAQDGVIDWRCRVFNYKNMYICDGAALGANLGVNPSLTICAVSEHAMSYIQPKAQADWNDAAEAVVAQAA
jgi:cholesterol oxidase